jgi:dipeptidyl aminopeptidase/acylaminoacyl peptidase
VLYLQDRAGDENWRLHDVDLETETDRDLTPFEGVQARVEHLDKRFPNDVLVGLNKDDPQFHDVYHLDLASGRLEQVLENRRFIGFVADTEFRVRIGVEPAPDGGMVVHVRDGNGDADWRPLLEAGPDDALTTRPIAFLPDGRTLIAISSLGANAGRLVRIDVTTGAEQVVSEDPQYDVIRVRLHPDTHEPEYAVFLKERAVHEVIDGAVADDLAALGSLDRGDLTVHGGHDDDRYWVAEYTRDDGPVAFYVYDREAKDGTFVFDHQPALAEYELAPMEPFSFRARDGLTIHGYLTFPRGIERRGLPAVMNVHGGPWSRDVWGFHPEAQWLANRGYLCIQVNYRGSIGYGKDFVNAGDREWGAKMHDDLVDAVAHVTGRGWADPARIGIYGGSYGGYAALVGATFTPDVFRCAVDIVGPSSLKTLIESIPPYWAPAVALFHRRVGNPATEEEFMWSRSPLSRVENIKIPLLIAQGANDPRVKHAESEQIVAAMREKGIPYEYLLFEDEGHGFAKPENRLRFYAAAERFLAQHLGGRSED